MEAIEAMRNGVAHNRRPTRGVIENYETARPELDRTLDEDHARWKKATPPDDLEVGRLAEDTLHNR